MYYNRQSGMNLSNVATCITHKPNILMQGKCLANRPIAWLVITCKLSLINF